MPEWLYYIPKRANRLAVRARILYLVIPTLAVSLLLLFSVLIFRTIANDSARRLARQYSIEAAANFQIYMNPHLLLLLQTSRSATVAQWMAEENDPESKARAFKEIMGYAVFSPDTYLMFTVYESMQAYTFYTDLQPWQFEPWGRVSPSGFAASQWFFDTRDAEALFIMNIQHDRLLQDAYIWLNHRVYYHDRFVGVVTAGFYFEGLFNILFGSYDSKNMRGYIIDRYGTVRADSAMPGFPGSPFLPEAAHNPGLSGFIDEHLLLMNNGIFQPGSYSHAAVPLGHGAYRYGSIAPIIGTDWSVVVLSNHMGVFNETVLMPLVLGAFAVVTLSMLVGSFLVRRTAILPLYRLTQSVSDGAVAGVKTDLFGLDRDDEIGELSRTVQYMRDSLNSVNVELIEKERAITQVQDALIYREKLLNMVNRVAEILLCSSEDETINALMTGMEIVGRCLDVDRVQIWRNEEINGELHFVMRYEWISDIGKQKPEIPIGLNCPYSIMPRWFEMLFERECINGPIAKLPLEEAVFLSYFEMKSIAILPLFLDKEFFGFFSANDCKRERTFTDDEMDIFTSAGLMFSNVFNRNEQRNLAYNDALTGIRNRRYLIETAEQGLQTCILNGMDFSLIMIDIDHFKSINDRYGHGCGDEVLKILTFRIRHVLKHDTLLARYGGEEFVVMLMGVGLEDAEKTAWRIQKAIGASAFRIGSLEINVTASFGVASRTARSSLPKILEKADKALYQAKRAGRNTVKSYTGDA